MQSVSVPLAAAHASRSGPPLTHCPLAVPPAPLPSQCSRATLDTTVRQLKTIIDPQKPATDYSNANFPVDQEGRTLHLGCKASNLSGPAAATPCFVCSSSSHNLVHQLPQQQAKEQQRARTTHSCTMQAWSVTMHVRPWCPAARRACKPHPVSWQHGQGAADSRQPGGAGGGEVSALVRQRLPHHHRCAQQQLVPCPRVLPHGVLCCGER